MHSHAALQPEHGRDKPLYPDPTHGSAVNYPQQIQEDPAIEDQETEAIPVDSPFTYSPVTPPVIDGYWTQTSDEYAGQIYEGDIV